MKLYLVYFAERGTGEEVVRLFVADSDHSAQTFMSEMCQEDDLDILMFTKVTMLPGQVGTEQVNCIVKGIEVDYEDL